LETIWEHGVTPEELAILFNQVVTQQDHQLITQGDPDSENAALYRLYSIRGDVAKAQHYLEQIQDKAFRFDVSYSDLLD